MDLSDPEHRAALAEWADRLRAEADDLRGALANAAGGTLAERRDLPRRAADTERALHDLALALA